MNEQKQLSTGEKLVGIEFNPSNDSNVAKAKELCAALINLVEKDREAKAALNNGMLSELYTTIYNSAIARIVEAQMNAVKAITFSY